MGSALSQPIANSGAANLVPLQEHRRNDLNLHLSVPVKLKRLGFPFAPVPESEIEAHGRRFNVKRVYERLNELFGRHLGECPIETDNVSRFDAKFG
ncbi:hypothetical protein D3C71_1952900 [compost metagenome]